MCELCDKESFKFYITFCRTHKDMPMIVSTIHKPKFTEEEKEMIKKMFPNRKIIFEQQSIKTHAHAHLD